MRTILKLAALSAALVTVLAGSGAQAQSVDLKVSAEIVPASCTMSLGNGGLFDYGRIAASTLNSTTYTKLPVKSTSLSIVCDAPTKVAILATDNRNGSQLTNLPVDQAEMGASILNSDTSFGLGTASGVKLGGYGITLDIASHAAGGTQTGIVYGDGCIEGSTIFNTYSVNRLLKKANQNACALASWGDTAYNGVPVAASTFSAKLNIQPVLNRGDALPLNGSISVDGHATITLRYL